jgi:hypothetical protein
VRRPRDSLSTPGHDSFLDVIANLVGILIILVMVVGMQARAAYIQKGETGESNEIAVEKIQQEVQHLAASGTALEQNINALASKLDQYQFEISYRDKEREKLLLLLRLAEQQLEERKSQLSKSQREQLEVENELAALEEQLESLRKQRDALQLAQSGPSILEHLPTPMAKTVFGNELHVRLQAGRVVVLPWQEIIDTLKAHVQQHLWKLRNAPEITEEAGQVAGFRIRYTLRVVEFTIDTRAGPIAQKRAELEQFELVPTSDLLGEPLDVALQPGSQFHAHLALADPRQTTLTVWVYPDSFDAYRKLRAYAYERGFLTAARPLPDGQLIGGSPHGTRSYTQ